MMALLQETPDYYKPLSLKVCKALDNIGASGKSRKRWKNAAFTNEILLSVLSRYTCDDRHLYYQFGGSAEGTTTLGLWSDVDTLFCKENVEVVQDLTSGLFPENKVCFLMISDNDTMPGYTKLQRLVNGVPQTVFNSSDVYVIDKVDNKGRFVVCRQRAENVHGPADMFNAEKRYPDQDIVYAYRCQTWPVCGSNWFGRSRYYQWPSAAMMEEMKTLGFFLVGVGHPNSREREKEWRISLSQQERMLMFSLNITQYKCYVMLKMIKKDIIFPLIGCESVSSYHLKTCLFYVIENSPSEVWVLENLLTCVQSCLMYLLRCCIDGKCPNYFIPEENMFEGRVDTSTRLKVQAIVQKLLSANFSFLLQIKCDYLTRQLRDECLLAPRFLEFAIFRGTLATRAYIGEIEIASFVSYSILSKCSKSNVDKCISSLLHTLSEINKIETVAEHNKFETKRVTSMLVSYLELSLISNIYVHQSMSRTASGTVLDRPFSKKWDELSVKLDRLSPKLKQAMFLYSSGYYRSSLDILKGLEFLGESSWMTLCNCSNVHTEMTGDIAKAVDQRNMSMEEFQKTFLAFCAVFLPSERTLIPTVLAYEMIRSVNMPPGSRDEKHDFWYDWAVLDGKFLLYFMLYLNHQKLSMRKNAVADISKKKQSTDRR